MEIKKIQSSTPQFGALNYDGLRGCSEELIAAAKKSPALRALGKRYDGSVSVERFGSKSQKNVAYYGLFIRDLKPVNFIRKSIDKLRCKSKYDFIQYNAGVTTQEEFIERLMNLKSRFFLK